MTADLAAWLLAADGPIAADEQVARDAARRSKADRFAEASYRDWRHGSNHNGDAVVAMHPARALAECTAKRQIVEAHAPPPDRRWCGTCGDVDYPVAAPCPTLLALAQPYAGRDGWREEWQTT